MMTLNSEQHGQVLIVYIEGFLIHETIEELMKLLNDQLGKDICTIGLDCKELRTIDPSSVERLTRFLSDIILSGIKLVFYNLSDSVSKIFKQSEWNNIFSIMTEPGFFQEYMDKCNIEK